MSEADRPSRSRFLVKLSGEALGGSGGSGVNSAAFEYIGGEIVRAHQIAGAMAVVVGGGNFFRGGASVSWPLDRVVGDHTGMLATVMNALLLGDWLLNVGCNVRVASAIPVEGIVPCYTPRQARSDLEQGSLVILAGGTGNPYFTTDTTACLRGLELDASMVIKATRVDGVFDRDPEVDPAAIRYDRITFDFAIRQGLRVMDSTAFAICKDHQLPICVLDLGIEGNLARAVNGESVGTLVSAQGDEE